MRALCSGFKVYKARLVGKRAVAGGGGPAAGFFRNDIAGPSQTLTFYPHH